jgi:hypothetical protein
MTGARPGVRCPNFKATEKGNVMELPSALQGESLTRLLQGAAAGVIATWIIGFNWGGWVSGGAAEMAQKAQPPPS